MSYVKLSHYNIWSTKSQETVRFYVDILGLRVGPRPSARVAGAWLYDSSDTPVVHLVDVTSSAPAALAAVGDRDLASLIGSGSIDHVAFDVSDFDGLTSKLTAAGISYRAVQLPAVNLRQVLVNDPNGIKVELNFRGGT
jgi:catechol 2,3-dioxygenase-like lactoylglutathione lyase family enzyme